MSDQLFDAIERAELCTLLTVLGPTAPTVLAPWTTGDLAAHLVLREHDPLAGPGLVVPGAWARFAERRRRALARQDFTTLVATIRSGPPPGFFRLGWVRRFPNLTEFFVHHEDVRRANNRPARGLGPEREAALWRNLGQAPWWLARRLHGVGLNLRWAGTDNVVRARRGSPRACLTGPPGELLLYLFGRQDVAEVEVSGPDAAVAAVGRTTFGM